MCARTASTSDAGPRVRLASEMASSSGSVITGVPEPGSRAVSSRARSSGLRMAAGVGLRGVLGKHGPGVVARVKGLGLFVCFLPGSGVGAKGSDDALAVGFVGDAMEGILRCLPVDGDGRTIAMADFHREPQAGCAVIGRVRNRILCGSCAENSSTIKFLRKSGAHCRD